MKNSIAMALLLALCMGSFSPLAHAGADTTRSSAGVGKCFPETDPSFGLNTMYCEGTMAGIRAQQVDGSRFANFSIDSSGQLYFGMVVNNVGYSCFGPSSMADVWRTAIASAGFFWIAFDKTTGVCKTLSISAGSASKTAL